MSREADTSGIRRESSSRREALEALDALERAERWAAKIEGADIGEDGMGNYAHAPAIATARAALAVELIAARTDIEDIRRREQESRRREKELREALWKSAEAHHGLADDPEHERYLFAECQNYHCVRARAALASATEANAE